MGVEVRSVLTNNLLLILYSSDEVLCRGFFGRLQELRYKKTIGDEVEDLEKLLVTVKQEHPDIQAVSSGAIASNYQRLRVESICSRLGLISLAYMWEQDQATLLQNMVIKFVDNPVC